MNPIIRAMRANIARRDNWAQIRIGACALLLPPLTLGAAFYSMLATPDEGAARPPGGAAKAQAVRPESPRGATRAGAASGAQPVAQASQSGKSATDSGVFASAPAMGRQPAGDTADETARVKPAPVRIAGAQPAELQQPLPDEMGDALRGALASEPSWSAPPEISTALLPRALIALGKAGPQIPTPSVTAEASAAEASAAQPPSVVAPRTAEGPRAPPPVARKHARSEIAAVRRNAQRRQHEFSLKDWLQQIGILPRNTRG